MRRSDRTVWAEATNEAVAPARIEQANGRHRLVLIPGAALDEQAWLALLALQQPRLPFARRHRADRVLGLRPETVLQQPVAGRRRLESFGRGCGHGREMNHPLLQHMRLPAT